jgi:hypothetical protein
MDPSPSPPSVLVVLGLLVPMLAGLTATLLRLFGVIDSDAVAYTGFVMGVGSYLTTRRLPMGMRAVHG